MQIQDHIPKKHRQKNQWPQKLLTRIGDPHVEKKCPNSKEKATHQMITDVYRKTRLNGGKTNTANQSLLFFLIYKTSENTVVFPFR